MELNMKATINRVRSMVKEFYTLLMVVHMKEVLNITKSKELDNIGGKMERYTRENGLIIKCMAKEY
jgi:hypothetical protein